MTTISKKFVFPLRELITNYCSTCRLKQDGKKLDPNLLFLLNFSLLTMGMFNSHIRSSSFVSSLKWTKHKSYFFL